MKLNIKMRLAKGSPFRRKGTFYVFELDEIYPDIYRKLETFNIDGKDFSKLIYIWIDTLTHDDEFTPR